MDFNYFRWISTLLIAQSTISIKNCVKFIQILLENGQIQSKIGQNLTYIVIQFYCQILSFEKMLKSISKQVKEYKIICKFTYRKREE